MVLYKFKANTHTSKHAQIH